MRPRRLSLIALEEAVARPGPAALALFQGVGGDGKTVLRHALRDRSAAWLHASALPPELEAERLARSLKEQAEAWGPVPAEGDTDRATTPVPGPWAPLFTAVLEQVSPGMPRVFVVEGAEPLLSSTRFTDGLGQVWGQIRAQALPVHVIFLLSANLGPPGGEAGPAAERGINLTPVHLAPWCLREIADLVPEWDARTCMTAYGLLGGVPELWRHIDPQVRLATNLARLALDPEGPARRLMGRVIRRATGGQERARAILYALAHGATTWGEIRRGAAVFRTSSEVGPYLKSLVASGLVEARRSLDAGPASRSTRYRLTQPLVGFWMRSIEPRLGEVDAGGAPLRILSQRLDGELPEAVHTALPEILREYLVLHGNERLRGTARESGGLWGSEYEIPVAGTLTSGAAVYGHAYWGGDPVGPDALADLRAQVKATRYGFDREARLELIFHDLPPTHPLARRAARSETTFLLGPEDVVGRE